ncbi:MAG TPA: TIGR02757 family protein, partial [Candidatus Scatomorpha intestinipullorum]|nr:TIGR02757 family protein [Candidatus Scatomorpha intestinipullorum]
MHSPIKLPKSLSKKFLYHLLEEQYEAFNHYHAISIDYPDPLGIARKFKNEKVALFCALFAYGNARAIVRFLE